MIENKLLLKRPMTMPKGVEVGFSVYGSLEAGVGWGSGEAQVVSDYSPKNRCQCQFNGGLWHLWSDWRKQSFPDGKQAFSEVSSGRPGWSKRAVLSDMD